MPAPRKSTKLGELLLKIGFINTEQLAQALEQQRHNGHGKMLGQILVEMGFINKDQLYAALAIQGGHPYIDVRSCVIDNSVLSLIPEALIRKYRVLPFDKIGGILNVAMSAPSDQEAIEQVRKVVDCDEMGIFLTIPSELDEALSRYYEENKNP